ncbi:ParB/Srx family N-terminal domain-containing protein [Lamprobacter modestohalophilus]|uniref:ParB/Srx family N-terminal domain-containing protein n=1 Tax=Lamprobacter modestohalophilus TaxID=1064514 RepID=UPI002ADEF53D|nr:ParB/Srx family N-terminal domain-containing protein [Lamprobacter modestohalophilus]MEA1050473.1 ParB/Srx family N-terminal domain-containing protein [Lamprobacter modestohalophilus]
MPTAKRKPAPSDIEPRNPDWPADRIEYCQTSELIPFARNARTHSDEQIGQVAASIREFGFTTPILRDEDGTVLAGHGRLAAAQRLGLTEVPVITARGWSEAKKRAYVITDNKVALNADWNYELLSAELEDLKGFEFDLSLTGFSDGELSNLLNADWEPPGQEPLETDEDSEDPDEEQERGHNIHLDAAQSAIWQQAVARLRESAPDLDEGQALVLLAEEYLTRDHDQAGE